ncbi:hypothetical protein [uncultured Pontibacter sp.]|uniref:hypothetical protein n=1 Tax=uncultured Pontibacter sp. TaxID=453356 RepID=UPI002610F957|nr:hypothetical protein [uncultured Pontibacter sp.]
MHEALVSEPYAYGLANSINTIDIQKPDSGKSQAFLFLARGVRVEMFTAFILRRIP